MKTKKFLTKEQYDFIYEKYKKLFIKISQRISGDNSLSVEDICQEMMLVANDVVNTFSRKYPEKSFDEFKNLTSFDKFIKTSFWNEKNSIGKRIDKKKAILKTAGEDDLLSVLKTDDRFSVVHDSDFLYSLLNTKYKELITLIIKNPDVIERSGNLNIAMLSRISKIPVYKINEELQKIRFTYAGK